MHPASLCFVRAIFINMSSFGTASVCPLGHPCLRRHFGAFVCWERGRVACQRMNILHGIDCNNIIESTKARVLLIFASAFVCRLPWGSPKRHPAARVRQSCHTSKNNSGRKKRRFYLGISTCCTFVDLRGSIKQN